MTFNGNGGVKESSSVPKRSQPSVADDAQTTKLKPVMPVSAAAKFNATVMRKLQKAIAKDPEVDLFTVFPSNYASRLAGRKSQKENDELVPPKPSESTQSNGHLSIPLPTDPSDIVRPLSDAVKSILDIHSDKASLAQGFELTNALARTLKDSEIIWQSKSSSDRYVAKLSSNLAVKSFRGISDFTEYTSMEFLELHKPHLPVPRPHGLITAGGSAYLFMALVPGISLNKIWPELQEEQKMDLSNELNSIFLDLRQLECPDGTPLGGPGGEGCKDTRRHTRVSEAPLYSSSQFWDFQYSGARAGSQVYLQFLRQLTSPFQARNCVFTHGDLRTENIMVQLGKDGKYRISGIIDWEMGGFYPADFECTKVTNTFAIDEMEDWYLYLPWCISPARFPSKWLSDRIWDSHIF